jgi:hypothetical protein
MDIAAALLKIALDRKNEGFDQSLTFHDVEYKEESGDRWGSKNKKRGHGGQKGQHRDGDRSGSYSHGKSGGSKHKSKDRQEWSSKGAKKHKRS